MVMRLLFMGTPQFAVPTLQALLSSTHRVQAVFTQPDRPSGRGEQLSVPPVKQIALHQSLPVYQPEKLKAAEWEPIFRKIGAEAFVVVAYGKILPTWLLAIPKLGAYNLHASLLPKYRGAAPIHWAIAHGETVTGVTTMKLDAGMDTGDLLLRTETEIRPEETTVELQERLSTLGADLMVETLDLLEQGRLRPAPQDPEKATYAPLLKKPDGVLDWEWSSSQIHNRIRAFNPWPGTYTLLEGQRLRVWKARPAEIALESLSPGTLLHHKSEGALVACGRGLLQLLEVQLENRRRTSALDLVHGLRLAKNHTLILGR
jgi:methionyl-tRNA formyltransferase